MSAPVVEFLKSDSPDGVFSSSQRKYLPEAERLHCLL